MRNTGNPPAPYSGMHHSLRRGSVLSPPAGAPHVDLCAVRSIPAPHGHLGRPPGSFADRCIALLNEYAPNFQRSVLARQVLTPLDLERTFNLTGGNIFQGAMTLNQLFACRPVPGFADYRTPIRGLYLCGAATHPGGGVMGQLVQTPLEILRAVSFGGLSVSSHRISPFLTNGNYCRLFQSKTLNTFEKSSVHTPRRRS